MRTPASVIKIAVNRRFPFRGQSSFCLTEREFEFRWARVLEDCCQYEPELLQPFKDKLMSRWARMPEEDNPKRRVYSPTTIPKRALPRRVKPEVVKEIRRLEHAYATATVGDGYDIFRKPHEKLVHRPYGPRKTF